MKLRLLYQEVSNQYSAWKRPDMDMLKREFEVEHEKKGRDDFSSFQDFLKAIKKAKVVSLSKAEDADIRSRSHTRSFKELLNLIKRYASYPKYRNEETLRALYQRFKDNKPMDMPIVFEDESGEREIFSGNTRLDIAFQLGITPKILLVKVDQL